ncbi:NAD-dependent epimerase/dehydratase family protein [Herbaspirillum sp. YR522]|uniref:NAD-dependent epimerase/dehydratase family protein n=1 Tax=Herbaspirillum sp. YR522 TaxID=1144342 RepID=UPI00026F914E|nr:NAD-dependent epimerase/dehydratase family protein [Herbaspirillum sp. YR522]EJN00869.1 nucleoside-diphosphate-sugar epimerase [Herbaspirillum sp. YR522]
MRTCVIGGAGFIGRHLAKQLLATGREVVVMGRRRARPEGLPPGASYVCCDYGDRGALRAHLALCDEVVDLAYATVPKTSFQDPMFDLQANLPLSVGMLQEAVDATRLRRLLIVSSGGTVYGPASSLPLTEDSRTAPISPYGITKLTIEHYGLMFHRLHGLPVTIVRPSNAYGAGQKPFVGQGFIATAIGRILNRESVTIFGQDGTVRDYLHVSDVASGILAALEVEQGAGEIYNIGSGIGRNNRDVLAVIERFASRDGYEVTLEIVAQRQFDVAANVLSSARLHAATGWAPKVDFADGVGEVWQDIRVAP